MGKRVENSLMKISRCREVFELALEMGGWVWMGRLDRRVGWDGWLSVDGGVGWDGWLSDVGWG